MKATRKTVLEYVQTQYSTQGERLWERYPEYVVLREYSPCVPLNVAKEHGICSVNGARKVPYGLYFALENKY